MRCLTLYPDNEKARLGGLCSLYSTVTTKPPSITLTLTRNRRRARMLNGYWVHFAPIGYKYVAKPGHGKVLVRNEPFSCDPRTNT